jgi:hypothetical protein
MDIEATVLQMKMLCLRPKQVTRRMAQNSYEKRVCLTLVVVRTKGLQDSFVPKEYKKSVGTGRLLFYFSCALAAGRC